VIEMTVECPRCRGGSLYQFDRTLQLKFPNTILTCLGVTR
jgi:hypothetical protein